jgi:hypothetical protein
LLKQIEKAKAGRPSNNRCPEGTDFLTLRDRGISKKQSANWQKMAAIPDEEFEASLTDRTHKPTTTGLIRAPR